ncbi:MAG: hypothetical protein ACWIPJ_03580, partial [Polaribacter sp.]
MKKTTLLLTTFILLLTTVETNAQEDQSKKCKLEYNFFKGDFKSKKYEEAYSHWMYLMDNCKDLSVNIYKYGSELAEEVRKDPALAKRVYEQRLQYFPKNNPAKVHSHYASYLAKNKLGTDNQIFAILEKAYSIDPGKMGVKNLYKYFQGVTDKYKDVNPQKVFDTYDDVLENISAKLAGYAAKIKEIKGPDSTKVLDAREKKLLRAYTINSKAFGQIEGGLDAIVSSIATCKRLAPLYKKEFESSKNDPVWLKRAVSRMFNKGCQKDPLYEQLARAYAQASPSPEAYSFLANVLEDNGDSSGANAMREKSFDLEKDPLKKAKYKLKFAYSAKSRGQLGKARSLAREALKFNPNYGK